VLHPPQCRLRRHLGLESPSSRATLRSPSPLRTGHESFPSPSSSPSKASLAETRFRYSNTLVMNPVMALRMKQNAILDTARATHHAGDVVMKAPSRGTGDFCITHRTESALFIPEKASTPKTLPHVIPIAFFKVGFTGRIIRVGSAFDLNVSFTGYATGEQQPRLLRLPLCITGFPKEDPVTTLIPLKISAFESARVFFRVSSSSPLPQLIED
jgi:hypothetical protein